MTDDPRFRRLFRAMMNDPSGFIMGDPTCCRLFRQMVGDPTSPDIGDIRVPPSIERVPDRWFVYAGVQLWSTLVRMLWCLLQT